MHVCVCVCVCVCVWKVIANFKFEYVIESVIIFRYNLMYRYPICMHVYEQTLILMLIKTSIWWTNSKVLMHSKSESQ